MPEYYRAGIYIRLTETDEGKSYESEKYTNELCKRKRFYLHLSRPCGHAREDEHIDESVSALSLL